MGLFNQGTCFRHSQLGLGPYKLHVIPPVPRMPFTTSADKNVKSKAFSLQYRTVGLTAAVYRPLRTRGAIRPGDY